MEKQLHPSEDIKKQREARQYFDPLNFVRQGEILDPVSITDESQDEDLETLLSRIYRGDISAMKKPIFAYEHTSEAVKEIDFIQYDKTADEITACEVMQSVADAIELANNTEAVKVEEEEEIKAELPGSDQVA